MPPFSAAKKWPERLSPATSTLGSTRPRWQSATSPTASAETLRPQRTCAMIATNPSASAVSPSTVRRGPRRIIAPEQSRASPEISKCWCCRRYGYEISDRLSSACPHMPARHMRSLQDVAESVGSPMLGQEQAESLRRENRALRDSLAAQDRLIRQRQSTSRHYDEGYNSSYDLWEVGDIVEDFAGNKVAVTDCMRSLLGKADNTIAQVPKSLQVLKYLPSQWAPRRILNTTEGAPPWSAPCAHPSLLSTRVPGSAGLRT
jgi:hypothetical protein